MANIGKFNAQALKFDAELTAALANLNFDFSLVKVEVPSEYTSLGTTLSHRKKKNAEDGEMHTLLRKLSALFAPFIPECSTLLRVYGLRASEIVRDFPGDHEQERRKYGIFFEYAGTDAASIWAAATSGPPAITIHLLACILARAWSASEAVSIWSELVEVQQNTFKKEVEESGSSARPSSIFCSKLQISRNALAELDSSARAWLRTADTAKKHQATQLRLIINNIGDKISSGNGLFDSVVGVWHDALRHVNGLLEGLPLNSTGADMLALSAWHLYPDMSVPLIGNVIKMRDPIMDGAGIITVGMSADGKEGLVWSLPLAHLRYYGRPVPCSRKMGVAEGTRLTIEEFIQVVLFDYLSPWEPMKDKEVLIFFEAFASNLLSALGEEARDSWLHVFHQAARMHLNAIGVTADVYQKLAALGTRRGSNFKSKNRQPLFGILDMDALVDGAKSCQDQINLLRQVASELNLSASSAVIRYKSGQTFEFASALPQSRVGRESTHVRWRSETITNSRAQAHPSTGLFHILGGTETISSGHVVEEPTFNLAKQPEPAVNRGDGADSRHQASLIWDLGKKDEFGRRDEYEFVHVAGNKSTTSLWVLSPGQANRSMPFLSIRNILAHISADSFDFKKLSGLLKLKLARLTKDLNQKDESLELDALRGISSLAKLCHELPHMTIDTRLVEKQIHQTAWCRGLLPTGWRMGRAFPDPVPMSRTVSFACIAMMESAELDISPQQLKAVMGISSENSMFVSSALVQDPSNDIGHTKVRRIHGNIGRAGMGLMISPSAPMVKEPALESWTVISHAEFGGELTDSFKKSSLHLNFTEYVLPMDSGVVGGRDIPAYFIETVISLFDQTTWIADLDILKALVVDSRTKAEENTGAPINSSVVDRNLHRVQCHCVSPTEQTAVRDQILAAGISCIDNWDELLEPPQGLGIVRAIGNWQARLAATALSVTRKHDTVVVPNKDRWCWKCTEEMLDRLERDQMEKPPVIIM